MRHSVVPLAALVVSSGCSIIYNTGNIPPVSHDAAPDMALDAPFDADPSMLVIDGVEPAVIAEGQGDGGSRRAILVLHGANFVTGAQVSISGANPDIIEVDNNAVVIPPTSDYLAVPVTAHVDPALADGQMVSLTIVVTQPLSAGGMTSQMAAGLLSLQGLDELDETNIGTDGGALKPLYSKVDVANTNAIAFAGGQTSPVLIRAVSSLTIGPITGKGGDASGTSGGAAGPGGCPGGPADGDGSCDGFGHHGNSTTLLNNGGGGGGAGFSMQGAAGTGSGAGAGGSVVGSALVVPYGGTQNIAAGGGGGGHGTLTNGGGGGGGGGLVELTAGGDVTADTIDVTGGNGAFSGSGGGGGAGGIIVLRAGHALSTGTLTASGGAGGGTSGNVGGNGSSGRIRWQAPTGVAPTGSPAGVRGPSFATDALVLRDASPVLQVIGNAGTKFDVRVIHEGSTTTGMQGVTIGSDSMATFPAPLQRGYDRVCITLMGGNPGAPESDECIDVAYLP